MEVRGVRRSWDTARRRLPRIRSFSASAFICSCRLICVVMVLVMMDTISITTAEARHSGRIRLNAQ